MMEMVYQVKQNTEDIAELKKKNNALEEEVAFLREQFDIFIKQQPSYTTESFEF